MSIAFGGILAFVFRGLNVLVALATVVLTSSVLGAEGRGVFVLGVTVVGVVAAATGGLTAATAYQVSSRRRSAGEVFVTGTAMAAALGAVAVFAGIAVAAMATGNLDAAALPVSLACAVVIIAGVFAGIMLGSDLLARYNVALVAPPLFALAAMGAVFSTGHDSARSALWAYCAGYGATLPLLALLALQGRFARRVRFEAKLARSLAGFAAIAGLASGISFLNYRADTFLVSELQGRAAVGVYANAVYIAESVWQVSGSLALAAYGRLGSLERWEAAELTARIMRHTTALLFVICGLLFVASGFIVDLLFAPEFAGTASALRYLLPGVWLYGLAAAFSGYYTYHRGQPWAAAAVSALGLAIDLPLAAALMPFIGVDGAALASAVAYSLAILAGLAFFSRDAGQPFHRLFAFGRGELEDYRQLGKRLLTAAASGRR